MPVFLPHRVQGVHVRDAEVAGRLDPAAAHGKLRVGVDDLDVLVFKKIGDGLLQAEGVADLHALAQRHFQRGETEDGRVIVLVVGKARGDDENGVPPAAQPFLQLVDMCNDPVFNGQKCVGKESDVHFLDFLEACAEYQRDVKRARRRQFHARPRPRSASPSNAASSRQSLRPRFRPSLPRLRGVGLARPRRPSPLASRRATASRKTRFSIG